MQRTVTFTMPDGEVVAEEFTQTAEFCVACGHGGTWANEDLSRRVCVHCRTVVPLEAQPYVPDATDIWPGIARQLEGEPSPAN